MTTVEAAAEHSLRAVLEGAEVPLGAEDQDAVYAVGRVLFDRGDHVDATHVFRLLALVAPTRSRSWTALASCHDVLGDVERARALYGLALEVTDRDDYRVFAAANKARLELEAGDPEAAEAALEIIDEPIDEPSLAQLVSEIRRGLRRSS